MVKVPRKGHSSQDLLRPYHAHTSLLLNELAKRVPVGANDPAVGPKGASASGS